MNRPENYWFFMGFLTFIAAVLIFLAGVLWYHNLAGISVIVNALLIVAAIMLSLLILILVFSLVGFSFFVRNEKIPVFFVKPLRFAVSYFLPLVVRLAGMFGIREEQMRRSYIYLVNSLVGKKGYRLPPQEILVLAPHCLQHASCNYKITNDLKNCHHCGKCQITDLVELQKKLAFHLKVATGGTMARKAVQDIHPKAIIAIACERDLMSGMQDVFPLPVLGIINIRPQGPCYNTRVSLEEVERTLELFTGLKA